jgi:putative flippase GtrA
MDYLVKVAKFGFVGLMGMCVDFFTTWLLKEKLKLNKYVANSTGFTCAVILNFFLNLHWTFQASGQNEHIYFIKFFTIALIGLGLNNLFVYLFSHHLRLNFYLSKVIAVALVFIWNFTANNHFNFSN